MSIEYLLCTHLLYNTVLMMREKVISAMMAQAKETDTKQRIDRLLKETHQHSDSEAAGPVSTLYM